MSINFTGIKNVGAMLVPYPENNSVMSALSLQLTNDDDGNDLDKFVNTMKSKGVEDKYIIPYEGAVSINVWSTEARDEYSKPKHHFYLNGSALEVKDENLGIFSYLAKLTKTIANKPEEDMGADIKYITSPDFINGSTIGYYLKQAMLNDITAPIGEMVNSIYNPAGAKAGAEVVNKTINDTMIDYIG